MLPYWQRKNDRMALVLTGMAAFYSIDHLLPRKRYLWDKCVWWGEPTKLVKEDDGRRAATQDNPDRERGGSTVRPSDRGSEA
jgi:hypothetical protein